MWVTAWRTPWRPVPLGGGRGVVPRPRGAVLVVGFGWLGFVVACLLLCSLLRLCVVLSWLEARWTRPRRGLGGAARLRPQVVQALLWHVGVGWIGVYSGVRASCDLGLVVGSAGSACGGTLDAPVLSGGAAAWYGIKCTSVLAEASALRLEPGGT